MRPAAWRSFASVMAGVSSTADCNPVAAAAKTSHMAAYPATRKPVGATGLCPLRAASEMSREAEIIGMALGSIIASDIVAHHTKTAATLLVGEDAPPIRQSSPRNSAQLRPPPTAR